MLYQKLIESTSITCDIPTFNLRAHSYGLDCLYIEIACQKNANSTRFLKVICKKKHAMRIRKMSSTKYEMSKIGLKKGPTLSYRFPIFRPQGFTSAKFE